MRTEVSDILQRMYMEPFNYVSLYENWDKIETEILLNELRSLPLPFHVIITIYSATRDKHFSCKNKKSFAEEWN